MRQQLRGRRISCSAALCPVLRRVVATPVPRPHQHVVPVLPFGRAQPLERDPGCRGKLSMPRREAVARHVRVSRADEHAVCRLELDQALLECCDRARPHATAGGHVQRPTRGLLEGRQAECVDGRLQHGDTTCGRALPAEAEQRLVSLAERAFVGRASHLDMGDLAAPAVCKPGAPIRTEADRMLLCCLEQDCVGDGASSAQIQPRGVAAAEGGPSRPSLGGAGSTLGSTAITTELLVGRVYADIPPQHLANLAEGQRRIEVPDEREHIPLGVAGRIPPATAVMVDDDDLAGPASVFQGPFRALAPVQSPASFHVLQHGSTAHAGPKEVQLRIGMHRCSPGSDGTRRLDALPCLLQVLPVPPGHREAGGRQGRSRRSRAVTRTAPCRSPGASGTDECVLTVRHAISVRLLLANGRASKAARDCEAAPNLEPVQAHCLDRFGLRSRRPPPASRSALQFLAGANQQPSRPSYRKAESGPLEAPPVPSESLAACKAIYCGMSNRVAAQPRPMLALNAIRLIQPEEPIPAVVIPFDLKRLHALLDHPAQDVFATRHGETDMAIVPLKPDAELPGRLEHLLPSDNMRLLSTLAREAVFRHLLTIPGNYRVVSRRPPIVESARQENVIPSAVGLPPWLKKRSVLVFQTRIIKHPGEDPYVVLTCGNRLRTVIEADCGQLHEIGVPLLGNYVSTWTDDPDPKVAKRLRLAGQVIANDGGVLKLADYGNGPDALPLRSAFLEPTRANFNSVVQALMQGRAERVLREVHEAEGELRAGKASLDAVQAALRYFGRAGLQIAHGVPLRFEGLLDQTVGPAFPHVEVFQKPAFSFDPSGSRNDTWTQRQLEKTGPYDHATFERKRPKIAVVCEARRRGDVAETVAHFLEGLPDIRSRNGLVPHGTGLVGRFRLQKPQVEFFEAANDSAAAYADAARNALSAAAARDQPWDLGLVQVQRSWKDRPANNSPYWSTKAAFLRRDVPVQALSAEMMGMPDFEYACALANASLATYAKLGGTPFLLKARPSTDHELVFGLGSHTHKEGRRGAGERVVGITTVFSSQGNYLLDARTAAVPFDRYPAELRDTLVAAVERVRTEEAWRASDTVRLVFHAFTQLRQETADAVIAAVASMGLSGVKFAFLHVAEDHPYTLFDHSAPTGRGAYAPERGQAMELSDHEWLLALTGRDQIRAAFQGIPDPVLLRLHEKSTFRDMRTLTRQVSDFACHSWRTYERARLPITLLYADEIAKQLAGLERTPGWDPETAVVGAVMRRPWFL